MVDSSWSGLNGFTIHPVAPACFPSLFLLPADSVVSISIGVSAVTPLQGMNQEVLIAAADQALYKAKEEGRDMVKSGKVTDISE